MCFLNGLSHVAPQERKLSFQLWSLGLVDLVSSALKVRYLKNDLGRVHILSILRGCETCFSASIMWQLLEKKVALRIRKESSRFPGPAYAHKTTSLHPEQGFQ
ncbi:hypothetical protein IMY05_010G0043500 [Salix suchowensis]|nr:hypothetical protein IMY05_010G0043500 [Salix suchowensis]